MGARLTSRNPLLVVAFIFIGGWASLASADQWGQPQVQSVSSPGGLYFVRIVPGSQPLLSLETSSAGAIAGVESTGSYAEFFARSRNGKSYRLVTAFELLNPVLPAYATVTDDGFLVTFDDWGSVGHDTVIAIYRSDGDLVRAIDIGELYQRAELGQMPFSVTMIQWRCRVDQVVDDADMPMVRISGSLSETFLLDPRTGTFNRQSVAFSACPPLEYLQLFDAE